MCVRGVEAAGAQEAQCHAHPRADEGWEDLAVCADGVAAFARRGGVGGRVVEVVDKVWVAGE